MTTAAQPSRPLFGSCAYRTGASHPPCAFSLLTARVANARGACVKERENGSLSCGACVPKYRTDIT